MFVKQIENGLNLTKEAKNIAAVYDTSLEPGQEIPGHFHPDFEEIYYVLSGYGIMMISDEKVKLINDQIN